MQLRGLPAGKLGAPRRAARGAVLWMPTFAGMTELGFTFTLRYAATSPLKEKVLGLSVHGTDLLPKSRSIQNWSFVG